MLAKLLTRVAAAPAQPELQPAPPPGPRDLLRLVVSHNLDPHLGLHPSWLPPHWPARYRRISAWDLDDGRVQFGVRRESFIGRGPRGYRRSDERVREDVCDALTDARDLDATDIEVSVRDGVVTLSGEVDDRAARRRADDIAAETSGVLDVMNQLAVRRDDIRRGAG